MIAPINVKANPTYMLPNNMMISPVFISGLFLRFPERTIPPPWFVSSKFSGIRQYAGELFLKLFLRCSGEMRVKRRMLSHVIPYSG